MTSSSGTCLVPTVRTNLLAATLSGFTGRKAKRCSREEALELLQTHGITDAQATEQILDWGRGSPLALSLAAAGATDLPPDAPTRELDEAGSVHPLFRLLSHGSPPSICSPGVTVPSAPAAAQTGGPELVVLVERLSGQVGVLERRLTRTRRVVRRSRTRIRGLERSLAERERPAQGVRRLVSPNRRFSVVATNDGLQLRGPASFLGLGPDTITLNSRNDTLLQLTPGSAGLRAPTGVLDFSIRGTLTAPLVSLGGQSGCRPAGRLGDAVRAGGEGGFGTITAGSSRVLAC